MNSVFEGQSLEKPALSASSLKGPEKSMPLAIIGEDKQSTPDCFTERKCDMPRPNWRMGEH